MPTVSIVKCDNYELEKVYQAIHKSLSLLNGVDKLVRPGMKVLLKLNLLSSSQPPERAVNTHPVVVRALVNIFQKDFGCDVFIGDSSGSVKNASTFNAFRITRINEIAEDTGAKIVNFDKDEYIDVQNKDYEILDKFRIARTLRTVDFVVSVPKLKTHGLTQYTGAIKNMLGSIPGNGKKNVHLIAPKPTVFAKALVDKPEDVSVQEVEGEKTTVLELKVAPEDLGKVIGKQGRTARAMRIILSATATKLRKRAVLEILE